MALIRTNRRFSPSATQQSLTLLDTDMGRPIGDARTVLDIEQIRLDGRLGPERSDRVVTGLTELLWRSPDLTERLLASQDLVLVREQAAPRLVDAVRQATARAARAVVQPVPDIGGHDIASAVGAARSFARTCADSVRRDLLALDGLSDEAEHRGRLTVEVRRDELLRCREDRGELKEARDRAGVELASRARAAGLPSEIADPLNLPRPALEPSPEHEPAHEPDAALVALTTEIEARVEQATLARDSARAEHKRLLRKDVPRPERPAGRRAAVGGVASVLVVLFFVAAVKDSSASVVPAVLGLLSAVIVVVCFGPWAARAFHHRHLARTKDELDAADRVSRLTAEARKASDTVRMLDDELVTAAATERRAAARYTAAADRRDLVARQLGLQTGCTTRAFAEAVRDRLAGLDRAFAGSPRFWWPDAVSSRPARDGDLISVDETSPVRGGLLEGAPGPRLLRAVDLDGRRVASDVWAVFRQGERRTALSLERRLQAWLTGGSAS